MATALASWQFRAFHVAAATLVIMIGLVVFHAPLTTYITTLTGAAYEPFIKAWKEILLGIIVALITVAGIGYRHDIKRLIKDSRIVQFAVLFIGIHLIVLLGSLAMPMVAIVSGLLIDLRFVIVLIAGMVLAAVVGSSIRRRSLVVSYVAAVISMLFAVALVFILPPDFLTILGYGKDIAPFTTIDSNADFVRINGTLRGPNPLGAYAGMIIVIALSWVLFAKASSNARPRFVTLVTVALIGLSLIALYASYARGAWVGAMCGVMVVMGICIARRFALGGRRIVLYMGAPIIALIIIGMIGYSSVRDSYFVSHVIEHRDPSDSNAFNSNEERLESLGSSIKDIVARPFGYGIGSTGSASIRGSEVSASQRTVIVENYYLAVAREVGIVGLFIFIGLLISVLIGLWHRRTDWLALGLFASGIGLSVIAFVLPVWSDDTIAIAWWGLSGIVLGVPRATMKTDPTRTAPKRKINAST